MWTFGQLPCRPIFLLSSLSKACFSTHRPHPPTSGDQGNLLLRTVESWGIPCAGRMGEQLALPGSLSPSFHHSAQAALHLTAPNSAPHSSRGVTPGHPSFC